MSEDKKNLAKTKAQQAGERAEGQRDADNPAFVFGPPRNLPYPTRRVGRRTPTLPRP